jgi:hypothetical protein
VCNRIWGLGCFCANSGLYLLYTSQNLLGTIFRVTFAVLYRRIWSIVGNYSILCCDTQKSGAAAGDSKAVEYVVIRIEEITVKSFRDFSYF